MVSEELRKTLFERYAQEGAVCDDDWFESFFESVRQRDDPMQFNIYWDNETDCGNFASGDEAEKIFDLSDNGFEVFWIESTFRGAQGPFEDLDGAVKALGYDPASFPPPTPDPFAEEE